MSKEARIKKIDQINQVLIETVEALAEEAEYDRKKTYSLQKRLAVVEEKLRVYELKTGALDHHLAPEQRLPTPE